MEERFTNLVLIRLLKCASQSSTNKQGGVHNDKYMYEWNGILETKFIEFLIFYNHDDTTISFSSQLHSLLISNFREKNILC